MAVNQTTSSENRASRAGWACLLAPLSIPVGILVLALVSGASFSELFDSWGVLFFGSIAAVSYGGFVIIGLPAILVLGYFGLLRIWTLAIAGSIGGAVVGYWLYHSLGNADLPYQPDNAFIASALTFSFLGIVVALAYGLIAGVRRW